MNMIQCYSFDLMMITTDNYFQIVSESVYNTKDGEKISKPKFPYTMSSGKMKVL